MGWSFWDRKGVRMERKNQKEESQAKEVLLSRAGPALVLQPAGEIGSCVTCYDECGTLEMGQGSSRGVETEGDYFAHLS